MKVLIGYLGTLVLGFIIGTQDLGLIFGHRDWKQVATEGVLDYNEKVAHKSKIKSSKPHQSYKKAAVSIVSDSTADIMTGAESSVISTSPMPKAQLTPNTPSKSPPPRAKHSKPTVPGTSVAQESGQGESLMEFGQGNVKNLMTRKASNTFTIPEESKDTEADGSLAETQTPRMILMLVGKPGAGKGTHGPLIQKMLDVPQLATGDMIRAELRRDPETELAKQLKAVPEGQLAPDEIVNGIVQGAIGPGNEEVQNGFILDGYPRSLPQSQQLVEMLGEETISLVIILDVADEMLEERICGRWMDKKSGRTYHVKFAPPKSYQEALKKDPKAEPSEDNMKDDETQDTLYQRADDKADTLKVRLQEYRDHIDPILDFLKTQSNPMTVSDGEQPKVGEVVTIDAGKDQPQICTEIFNTILKAFPGLKENKMLGVDFTKLQNVLHDEHCKHQTDAEAAEEDAKDYDEEVQEEVEAKLIKKDPKSFAIISLPSAVLALVLLLQMLF